MGRNLDREVFEKLETLQNILIASVTGGERNQSGYRELREQLLDVAGLKDNLPRFVRTSSDPSQIWHFIKGRENLQSYASRREYIWNAFRPLLAGLDDESELEREAFFPKGSEHDAYVHIRGILQSANAELFIIDPYMDGSIYQVLGTRRSGEGLMVEFKKSISFEAPTSVDRVLETIAAFANTADGAIFIGIEDNGTVRGLRLEGEKARDSLKERLHQAVRNRIRPQPTIHIDFLEEEGHPLCRIFVPRGEQPLHLLDGVIYVRDGASDIKAPPERVLKLVEEFAV